MPSGPGAFLLFRLWNAASISGSENGRSSDERGGMRQVCRIRACDGLSFPWSSGKWKLRSSSIVSFVVDVAVPSGFVMALSWKNLESGFFATSKGAPKGSSVVTFSQMSSQSSLLAKLSCNL
ncbi:hypothetical protein AVEN_114451-1 [Araneus ventricosus]|uniref:Secreted protein n=1 Tax=Araneus ventricosus TaxID=182803 RepID=A0A4Y2M1B3_ARAVE|nr:hypothetical protein AVEN_114451-1 [Araneus ventricosus]